MEEVWNHKDSSKTEQTEQSAEKSLGQGGDQETNGHSDRAPEFCGDGRTFQKDNHLCTTALIQPLW